MLATLVPYGNPQFNHWLIKTVNKYRPTAPKAPPTAMYDNSLADITPCPELLLPASF
jgi:hypothetical protein